MSLFIPGIALIISHRNTRPGTDIDEKNLEKTLQQINVTVKLLPYDDVETRSIDRKINEFIEETDFSLYEYVIIAYFSHGDVDEQILMGKNCAIVQRKILNPLFKVAKLKRKLKWLIIQACAGKYDCHLGQPDAPAAKDIKEGQMYFLKSFSSHEGCKSYRIGDEYEPEGSIYIRCLCDNLRKYAAEKDIQFILHETRNDIENFYVTHIRGGSEQLTQEPRNTSNFNKKFYFTNGFSEQDKQT